MISGTGSPDPCTIIARRLPDRLTFGRGLNEETVAALATEHQVTPVQLNTAISVALNLAPLPSKGLPILDGPLFAQALSLVKTPGFSLVNLGRDHVNVLVPGGERDVRITIGGGLSQGDPYSKEYLSKIKRAAEEAAAQAASV